MSLVLTFLFSLFPKSKCHDPKSFSCSLCFQRQTRPLSVVWEHLKGRLRRQVWEHKASQWHLQWEGSLLSVQDDYSRILCVSGGDTEYGQPVLPLPFTVWFRTMLRKEFQTYNQINPSIAENCFSCKHLPCTCIGRKVHNKPLWILPFAVATEGIFLSAGDMVWWGQKLSVAKEKG